MESIVEIHAMYEELAEAKLAKLQRRGAKYGQAIEWSAEPFERVFKRKRWDGKEVDVAVPMIRYAVKGEAPSVGDYRFVAQLERVGEGVIIQGEEVGDLGRGWKGECQHCNLKRARSYGYVVEGADGERKIVGKACLADHVGRKVPADALWAFQWLPAPLGAGDEEKGWGYGGNWQDDVIGVLAAARAVIALFGWVAGHREDQRPSYARVDDVLWSVEANKAGGRRKSDLELVRAELKERGDHYQAVAQEVVDWAAALQPRNDYENNLKVAVARGFVPAKFRNLVISAAAAFDRQVERARADEERKAEREKERAEDQKVSKWFGKVGEKYEAELELRRKVGMPDRGFGPSVLYVFKGPEGELIKWFCSGAAPRINGKPVEVGERFKAKFSVKRHGEFNDVKESVVLRLKVA